MSAMRAGDVVVSAQICAHTDGDRFFSYINVNETWHLARSEDFLRLKLEFANLHHAAIKRRRNSFWRFHCDLPSSHAGGVVACSRTRLRVLAPSNLLEAYYQGV